MVEIFLQEFRKAVRNDKWQFVCRKKNIDFLALIGWTEEVAVEYLAENLEKKHYVKGFSYLSKVRFVKFLWFIDKAYYDKNGKALTGLTYER